MSTAAAMPLPIFRDQGTDSLPTFNFTAAPSTTSGSCNNNYNSNCNNNTSSSSPYRPSVSSPLSSSPIRASPTMTTPPLSPRDPNAGARFRAVQSSPIPETTASKQQQHSSLIFGSGGGGGGGGIASKFASRPTRPVPLNLKREAAQESRRRLFLKNVRQRAEDKRWEMRGGEQELLKLEWFSLNRELRTAKNADFDGLLFDSDIEEAARLREEVMRKPLALGSSEPVAAHGDGGGHHHHQGGDHDADAMMVDMLEQEQQAELEAMLASAPEEWVSSLSSTTASTSSSTTMKPPDSPHWSDDDAEYDALFMDFVNSREGQPGQDQDAEMDLS